MKILFFLVLVSVQVFANVINSQIGDIYTGDEYYNHRKTGRKCHIIIHDIQERSVGKHCHELLVKYVFSTNGSKLEKKEINLFSSMTRQSSEHNSCAMKVYHDDPENVLYGDDTERIYNQMFSNESGNFWKQYHYFLVYSSSKELREAKIHFLNAFLERDWTCSNLKLQ